RFRRYAYAERIHCAVVDATAAGDEQFDLILCDVPCSGTGTLAGNPEIRHRLKPEEFARQSARQRAILGATLKRLAPGGRLIYSTCSLEPEECEQVVEDVIGAADVHRIPVEDLIVRLAESDVLRKDADLVSAVRDGALRTLPGVQNCDGFFAAVLERGEFPSQ
ncbi:MAG: RNA methyltransferase, partial [Edaphobacter sp.]